MMEVLINDYTQEINEGERLIIFFEGEDGESKETTSS